jgi:hypothetical protein
MNGWGGNVLDYNILTNGVYEGIFPYSGIQNDNIGHKYFMDLDSATASTRFPGYENDADGVRYEHPATLGDGNRVFTVTASGNLAAELRYFNDVNPSGVLLNATDTTTVTLTVNMGPATRDAIAFNPATDTVRVNFIDRLWAGAQARNRNGVASAFPNLILSPVAPGDTMYWVSFDVIGPAHYNIMYLYRFTQPGGTASEEGAGLGALYGRRSRFIQPLGANSFPRQYSAPVDTWLRTGALPAETPPFNPLASVREDPTPGIPEGFKLGQNYPNPFNPSTNFKYTIPEKARVTIKVFNLLGQEVATLLDRDQAAGNYVVKFEANSLPTGIYFYRLEAGKVSETRKMVLLK